MTVSNVANRPAAEHAARLRFQKKLDEARRTNDYSFFRGSSSEFFEDMLDWVERTAWLSKRDQLGRERATARTLSVISDVGMGVSFLPVVGQIVGVPLATLAGVAAAQAEAGFAGFEGASAVAQGGVVYGAGAQTQGLTELVQVAQNAGTPGAKLAVDAAKVSTPGINAAQLKAAEIDAGVTIGSTVTVIASAGVGGLAGDVIDAAGKLGTQGAAFAARGDYSPEASLEFGIAAGGTVLDLGVKEVTDAGSIIRGLVSKGRAIAQQVIAQVRPLAPAPQGRAA